MENQLTVQNINPEILESLVINGDLSKLEPKQKVEYYTSICKALGLNPLTQPFKIMKLQGKETMYCDRSGVAQLSKLYNVSHSIVSAQTSAGVYLVTAKAFVEGRSTTSTGAVTIEGLKGDALCNALMKAETKAKRRATLDLLGLGMLDDSETQTIPGATTTTINAPHEEVKTQFVDNTLDNLKKDFLKLIDNDIFNAEEKDSYCSKMDSWTIKTANKAIDLIKVEIEKRELELNNQ